VNEVRVLKKVRDLIDGGWIKGSFAQTEDGESCSPNSKKSVCYCLLGAINRATKSRGLKTNVINVLAETIEPSDKDNFSLAGWNDNKRRTKQQVLNAIDKTIKRLEKQAI
jgi:hypothetical protein